MEKRVKERAETSGREDDKEEILKTRIEVYRDNTTSLVDSLVQTDKAVKVTMSWCVVFSVAVIVSVILSII